MRLFNLVNISTSKLSFRNEPIICTPEEYNNTKDKIVGFYSKMDEVVSIYQMGSVSVPGISDLDIIVVFDRPIKSQNLRYNQFLTPKEQYIAGHRSPFIIDKKSFENLNAFFYPSNLTLLYGKNLFLRDFPKEMKDVFKLSYSIDAVLAEFLWLINTLLGGKISIRNILCHLSSVKYDIQNLKDITGVNLSEEKKFISKIGDLRGRWFEYDKDLRLNALWQLSINACEILSRAIKLFGNYLKENYLNNENALNSIEVAYLADLNALLRFQKNRTFEIYLLKLPKKNRFLFSFIISIPLAIVIPFLLYSAHNSALGWQVKKRIFPKVDGNKVNEIAKKIFVDTINYKMNILAGYEYFLSKIPPSLTFIEGPWFGDSRLYRVKQFFWKTLLLRL